MNVEWLFATNTNAVLLCFESGHTEERCCNFVFYSFHFVCSRLKRTLYQRKEDIRDKRRSRIQALLFCLVAGAEASSFNTCLGMVQEKQSSLPTYSGPYTSCLKDAHGANRQPHCLRWFHPHRRRTQQERHLADQLQAYAQNQSHRQREAWKDVAQLRFA